MGPSKSDQSSLFCQKVSSVGAVLVGSSTYSGLISTGRECSCSHRAIGDKTAGRDDGRAGVETKVVLRAELNSYQHDKSVSDELAAIPNRACSGMVSINIR